MTSTPVSLPFDYEFRHPTWVDTVDRVAAGGPNGFNALFEALQKDLTAIDQLFATAAGAVNALQAKVDALGQPQAVNRSVTVIPMLAGIAGQQAWDVTSTPGSAAKPAGAATAQGLVTVALPAGSVITGFKAGGSNIGSGLLALEVHCQRLDGSNPRVVAKITVSGLPTGGVFPANPVTPTGDAVVDPGTVCYITAKLSGAQGGDTVTLSGFQVLYSGS
ncbi:hypothetical protein [Streptomyces sp. RKAG293]|uniref:hypothetical protein n=1 Tax=Streptomyces sp. RKAG293 TaxID=2893403 RepID=UPI0020334651|nr:hypothetical protein [Streptomyces sp. RKAG293]MCM2422892.1 hypothetical protein [Streptomyces sp. RKAG293]